MNGTLGWVGIIRCGLVQAALGSIVVLTTSTYNRVMVVELALAAMVPGALVALHYAVQMSRPKWGHGSDIGGRRTPWILGGMSILGFGAILAAIATVMVEDHRSAGLSLAVFAYVLIGLGVGASGTSLLALLATHVVPARRAAAATITWLMMIFGIAVTATVAGQLLDPFGPGRLIAVASAVALAGCFVTLIATWRLETGLTPVSGGAAEKPKHKFRDALAEVWSEPEARRFTIFVFMSMLAYNTQDLILEPFAGLVFGMTPGESTKLAGVQHGGVFTGMVIVALASSGPLRRAIGSLRGWTVCGCVGSGAMMGLLAVSGAFAPAFPLTPAVFLLGLANGAFAVAAIASMMKLAGAGRESREGIKIGLWGASQAIAFGVGGFMGTVLVDVLRAVFNDPVIAYGGVFGFEALLFLVSAVLAAQIRVPGTAAPAYRAAPAE